MEGTNLQGLSLLASQRGVWIAQALASSKSDYNVGQLTTISGAVDPQTFSEAARHVVEATEALRLRFDDHSGEVRQIIDTTIRVPLTFIDLADVRDAEVQARQMIDQLFARPFNLQTGPLFAWLLLRISPEKFLWSQIYHHVAVDGFGRTLIARRLAAAYNQLASGRTVSSEASPSLSELVREEMAYAKSEDYALDRDYWVAHCAALGDRASLAHRIAAQPARPRRQLIELDAGLVSALETAARGQGANLPRLITAVVASYLHRFTGIDETLVGFQVANRKSAVTRITPAMLTNTVPLMLRPAPKLAFEAILAQCCSEIDRSSQHQRFPWVALRQALRLSPREGDPFGVIVNYVAADSSLTFAGAPARTANLARGPVQDLQINVDTASEPGGLRIELDGNPELYPAATLAAHGTRLMRALRQIAADGCGFGLADLAILDPAERDRVVVAFNQSGSAPAATTLSDLFDEQVCRTPEAAALVCGASRISYAELDSAANRLARHLIAEGIGPGNIVGILFDRSTDFIVALLAVLKSGAAYQPFDLATPLHRIRNQLADSLAAMLLAPGRMRAQLDSLPNLKFLALDDPELQTSVARRPGLQVQDAERLRPLRAENTAYVIYTSGSTGKPKGVIVSHRAIASQIVAMHEIIPMDRTDTLLCVMSMAFDAANADVFLALLSGATLAFLRDEECVDPDQVAAAAKRLNSTVLDFTPSFWRLLPNERLPADQRIMVGGEAFPADLVERCRGGHAIFNCYGPTEATVTTSAYRVTALSKGEPVPIGRPLRGYQMYILNREGTPQPVDAVGELWIAGIGLADGYIGDQASTMSRFVSCPFGPPGTRMYRSGDLAYWRDDGCAIVLGRSDDQVKINGYRVEPGEVEHALTALPGITQAAVVARPVNDRMRLIAYVVPTDRSVTVDATSLRTALAARLPAPMLPAAFVRLDTLPLTLQGKLDRRALPEPKSLDAPTIHVAPRTALEVQLCDAYARALQRKRVGIYDNFFEHGGDSLTAVLLIVELKKVLNRDVPIGAVFDHQTPAALAEHLQSKQPSQLGNDSKPVVFLVPGLGGEAIRLRALRQKCAGRLNMVIAQLPDWHLLFASRYTMASFVETLAAQARAASGGGPIVVAGYSAGGVAAYALAEALITAGHPVSLLAILDTDITQIVVPRDDVPEDVKQLRNLRRFYWDMVKLVSPELREKRGERIALTLARILTSKPAIPLLRRLGALRRIRFHTRFRYFLRRHLTVAAHARLTDSWKAMRCAAPRPLEVPTVLFVSGGNAGQEISDLGWRPHLRALRIVAVEGDHASMFDEPQLEILSARFTDAVEGAALVEI